MAQSTYQPPMDKKQARAQAAAYKAGLKGLFTGATPLGGAPQDPHATGRVHLDWDY